jgi:anti-sigma B factor antagonist
MSDLTVTAREGLVLELAGDLDLVSVQQVLDILPTLPVLAGTQLVLDLTAVEFCDSTGITALLVARNTAVAADGGIALAGVPDHLAQMFHIVGLDTVFPVYPTVSAAHAAWPPSGD